MVPTPSERLLASLEALPAGRSLLEALSGLTGVHLVGGAVRDLLIERVPHELDLVSATDGPALASELAARLGGTARVHAAFGTATVQTPAGRLDVATARAESYPRPGALPVVRPGSLEEDLRRRDFTVNAIAVGLSDDVRGEMTVFPGAVEDLDARRLRVLHDGSFSDDATRLVRLARYAPRLSLVLHPRTEQLARAACADGMPATVGWSRWAAELWLLLGEERAVDGLVLLAELAGHAVPGPVGGLRVEPDRLTTLLGLLPPDASSEHALLAALAAGVEMSDLLAWLDEAHVHRPGLVADAARDPAGLAEEMRAARSPSALAAALRHHTAETVAVAGAHGAEDAARRWLGDLRHVRLEITGDDLMAAGVPKGPELGRRLDVALARKLDGDAPTREAELAAALKGQAL